MRMGEFSARVYRVVFGAAAMYNIAFGLWAALAPRAFFDLFHLDSPRYPAIWACLGMVVGLYGVGYAYAAWRLDRALPFIAIGLAVTVAYEIHALAVGQWSYAQTMPTIAGIGVLPILQWLVIPIAELAVFRLLWIDPHQRRRGRDH